MATFDVAKLLNIITQDIPGINTVLKALANWDVSALSDVPDGAMQATTDSSNRLTIKKKVSGSYAPVAKLMHDVDKLDGYHASASATANAVAVRDASGALPGNILGNAATADKATALAAGAVVPVNQGGTGATTASQARANLGVADGADFTAHIAKQASPSVEGHVKLDALAADGSNTAAPGGFGLGMPEAKQIPANTDLNTVVLPGFYSCKLSATAATLTNCPVGSAFSMLVEYGAYGPTQTITTFNTGTRFQRTKSGTTTFSAWRSLPNGITDSTATTSSTVAASATAVKAVNDATVHLAGAETISGDKTFTGLLYVQGTTPTIQQKHSALTAGTPPSSNYTYGGLTAYDKLGMSLGGLNFMYLTTGVRRCQIGFPNSAGTGRIWPFTIEVAADDTSYATITTPPAGDNSSKIATTAWVTNNALPVGTRMLFQQSTAPTGWTKDASHNDKALRVVNGTVGSGGSVDFSTLFGRTATDAFTLTTAQMPSHGHNFTFANYSTSDKSSPRPNIFFTAGGPVVSDSSFTDPQIDQDVRVATAAVVATGSGGGHSHSIDMRVKYVDLIIATKD